MGVITFGGIASDTIKIVVEEPPEYHFPARDYEAVHIPGRNGDLVLDSGSYQNVPREYKIAIVDKQGDANEVNPLTDFMDIIPPVSTWLHSGSGYQRLEDSYDKNVYRLAYYKDDGSIENILGKAGRCTISFDCKPQRFLKSGETPITFTSLSSMAITAGVWYSGKALPLITITGSGSLRLVENIAGVGKVSDMTITNIDGSVTIDSDTQNVYKGSISMNPYVSFADNTGFPYLASGYNTNTFVLTTQTGSFSKVEVIPRWWTL